MNTIALATQAVREAMLLRAQNGYGPADAVCPYDLAIKLKIKVSFESVPSLEGVYSPRPTPHIILSSERPAGRRRYTCGHEIGHHIFNHGERIDELDESNSAPWSPEEFLAQRFSGALLMPQIAVNNTFSRRGWNASSALPEQFYIVAQELGVGFTTLVFQSELNLRLISKAQADKLRGSNLVKIRTAIVGAQTEQDVYFVDKFWLRSTIDAELGDLIMLPEGAAVVGDCVTRVEGSTRLYKATAQGTGTVGVSASAKPLTLRVSRKNFVGNARYRHLEDVA